MNRKQESIYNQAIRDLCYGKRIVKDSKVDEIMIDVNGSVDVMIETGYADHDYCDSCYFFNIGKRGGISVLVNRKRRYIKLYDLPLYDIYRRH